MQALPFDAFLFLFFVEVFFIIGLFEAAFSPNYS
jgi:hypothetical protein